MGRQKSVKIWSVVVNMMLIDESKTIWSIWKMSEEEKVAPNLPLMKNRTVQDLIL
jgi:hypothetical protein